MHQLEVLIFASRIRFFLTYVLINSLDEFAKWSWLTFPNRASVMVVVDTIDECQQHIIGGAFFSLGFCLIESLQKIVRGLSCLYLILRRKAMVFFALLLVVTYCLNAWRSWSEVSIDSEARLLYQFQTSFSKVMEKARYMISSPLGDAWRPDSWWYDHIDHWFRHISCLCWEVWTWILIGVLPCKVICDTRRVCHPAEVSHSSCRRWMPQLCFCHVCIWSRCDFLAKCCGFGRHKIDLFLLQESPQVLHPVAICD